MRFTSASCSSVSMPLMPRMIGLHVQHRADIDLAHAHAGAQQAAARGLQHGDVDLRIGQHHARRHRPGHVALTVR
jgi:hypothetical protein